MVSAPRVRARELDLPLGRFKPGKFNAITDVEGVLVGHSTIIEGDGAPKRGVGPIRTGVTAILPRAASEMGHPLFAGTHRLNGNGELTGLEWIRESGLLTSPICLTNTPNPQLRQDQAGISVQPQS